MADGRATPYRAAKYATIVADPPWDYGADHERWPSSPTSGRGGKIRPSVTHHGMPYAPLTLAAIEAIPVAEFAADDCRLFLWSTSRFLPSALRLLEAWGFAYRQTTVWRKTGNPSPFGGSVAPNHAEFLLIGTRGAPPRAERWTSSVIEVPSQRVHSRKPEVFLDLVEQVSPGPYLELFARRNRMGWDTWGDEALEHVEMAT